MNMRRGMLLMIELGDEYWRRRRGCEKAKAGANGLSRKLLEGSQSALPIGNELEVTSTEEAASK